MNRRPPPPSDKALQGLAKHREAVAKAKRRDIENALKQMRKTNAKINISTVATRAGVQRKTIHKHHDLLAVIDQYRHKPPVVEATPNSRDNSIIAALRAQLAAKDNQIKKLKTTLAEQKSTIEMLYGQLDQHTS